MNPSMNDILIKMLCPLLYRFRYKFKRIT